MSKMDTNGLISFCFTKVVCQTEELFSFNGFIQLPYRSVSKCVFLEFHHRYVIKGSKNIAVKLFTGKSIKETKSNLIEHLSF